MLLSIELIFVSLPWKHIHTTTVFHSRSSFFAMQLQKAQILIFFYNFTAVKGEDLIFRGIEDQEAFTGASHADLS